MVILSARVPEIKQTSLPLNTPAKFLLGQGIGGDGETFLQEDENITRQVAKTKQIKPKLTFWGMAEITK